jgi:hypothetical protein
MLTNQQIADMIYGKKKEPTDMVSLFDYLGYPAGETLGKQVADYATIRKTKYGTRYISTHSYKGNVMLYTRAFLDEFFQVKDVFTDKTDYTAINTELTKDSFDDFNFNNDLIF